MSTTVGALEAALERARSGRTFEFHRLGAPTMAERAAQIQREQAIEKPDFSDQVDAALELESQTRGLVRRTVQNLETDEDPNYTPPSPGTSEFDLLTEGVPPEYWPRLARSRSAKHAELIRQNVSDELAAMDTLRGAGWTGTALRLATAVMDPVSLSAIVLTGGSNLIMSGSRMARAAKLAAAAGVENVALEATLMGTRETKEVDDLYYALVGGIVAGGVLGAAMPAAARRELYQTGKRLTEGEVPPQVAPEILGELDESLSVGAAQTAKSADPLGDQLAPEVLQTPKLTGAEAKLRRGWWADLAKSDNPMVRYLGGLLLENRVGSRGTAVPFSVEEFAGVLKRRSMTFFWRDTNKALAEHLQGVPLRRQRDETNRFFESVTAAVRTQDFTDSPVGRAASAMARAIRETAEQAKRHGVKGFEKLDLTEGYVPRIPSAEKVNQLVQRYGDKQVERLFVRAFMRAAEVAEDVAQTVAHAYLRNVRLRGANAMSDFRITTADRDALTAMMRDADIDEAQIAKVNGALKSFADEDTTKAGKIARAKRRLDLDESTVARLTDRAGESADVAVTDLFENDARILARMYIHSVAGHAALARAGIISPADWERMLRQARIYSADHGIDSDATEKALAKLQGAHDILTGKPRIDYNDTGRALGFVARDWAYVAQSGMFGLAQASELAAVLQTGGFRLITESVPALKGLFKRARNGDLEDAFARELEDFVAPGTDAMIHATVSRFEGQYDEALAPRAHTLLEKTEGFRHGARKLAGYASGLTPLTIVMQRLNARWVAQRLVNTATRSKGRSYSELRLTAMGLEGRMRERVFNQLREHATFQTGANGRRIPRLDLERWTDLEARDTFVLAVNRENNRTVLVPGLGSTIEISTRSEIAKVMTQFMTFVFNAHEAILLHGLKHMDAERTAAWMTGTVLAGMAYVGRTHLESVARDDRKKFLRERLAPGKIAAASFRMSGFASLLPELYDTAAQVVPGVEPVFTYSRTSGLGTSFLDPGRYPAGAMVKGALDMTGVLNDGQFTDSDWRGFQRLLPFSRALGVRQALDAIGNTLPEKQR